MDSFNFPARASEVAEELKKLYADLPAVKADVKCNTDSLLSSMYTAVLQSNLDLIAALERELATLLPTQLVHSGSDLHDTTSNANKSACDLSDSSDDYLSECDSELKLFTEEVVEFIGFLLEKYQWTREFVNLLQCLEANRFDSIGHFALADISLGVLTNKRDMILATINQQFAMLGVLYMVYENTTDKDTHRLIRVLLTNFETALGVSIEIGQTKFGDFRIYTEPCRKKECHGKACRFSHWIFPTNFEEACDSILALLNLPRHLQNRWNNIHTQAGDDRRAGYDRRAGDDHQAGYDRRAGDDHQAGYDRRAGDGYNRSGNENRQANIVNCEKTKLCKFFMKDKKCLNGKACTYAHGNAELVNSHAAHTKTCPDGENCRALVCDFHTKKEVEHIDNGMVDQPLTAQMLWRKGLEARNEERHLFE
jgi:hypothetical protein